MHGAPNRWRGQVMMDPKSDYYDNSYLWYSVKLFFSISLGCLLWELAGGECWPFPTSPASSIRSLALNISKSCCSLLFFVFFFEKIGYSVSLSEQSISLDRVRPERLDWTGLARMEKFNWIENVVFFQITHYNSLLIPAWECRLAHWHATNACMMNLEHLDYFISRDSVFQKSRRRPLLPLLLLPPLNACLFFSSKKLKFWRIGSDPTDAFSALF